MNYSAYGSPGRPMPIRPLLTLLTITLLSGCFSIPSIRFYSQTSIGPDGSVQRTVVFQTDAFDSASVGQTPLEELRSKYTLPAGGEWAEHSRTEYDREGEMRVRVGHKYTKMARFPSGAVIPTDFRRHGVSHDNIASNNIRISASRFGFWATYRYQETFSDVIAAGGFVSAAEEAFKFISDHLGKFIEQLPDAEFENAGATIRRRYRSMFEEIVDVFVANCIGAKTTKASCDAELDNNAQAERFMDLIDDEDTLLQDLAHMFPAPPAHSADEWFDILEDMLEEAGCEDCTEWPTYLSDDLFGVHEFLIFKSYPFEASLTMPGDMISNNADLISGSTLTWKFSSHQFQYRAHELVAKSRIIYWNRFFALFLTMLILGLWLRARAKQSAASTK